MDRRFALVSGLSTLLFMGLAFFFANVLPAEGFPSLTEGYPSPFRSSGEIEGFVSENRGAVRALSTTLGLLALSLLTFASSTTWLLRQAAIDRVALLIVAFAGGVLASAFLMLSAILTWTLPRSGAVGDTPVLRTVHDLTFMAGGPAHVLFVSMFLGAASLALLHTSVVPRWLIWLGIAGGAVSGLAVVAMIWQPATYVLPASRLFLGAWILGICLTLVGERLPRAFRRNAAPAPAG